MRYSLIEIKTIEEEDYSGMVFDLMVEEDHSYTVEQICVHNSICSTRINTGNGAPTAQSIIDCAEIKETLKLNTLIVADGGCCNGGDCTKALGLGADYIMLGSLLAGTDECPGNIVNGKKMYRGMSAKGVMGSSPRSVEGITSYVSYQGPVSNVLDSLAHNIRSGLSYSGALNIPEFQRKAVFTRQTTLGMKETRTHINER